MKKIVQSSSVIGVRRSANNSRSADALRGGSDSVNVLPSTGTSGASLRSTRAMRSGGAPRSTRKRIDSGRMTAATSAAMHGSTPPSTKIDRQPKLSINAADAKPPAAAPMVTPQNMIITVVARMRAGVYSAVSAMVFGIAPPRPSPVRIRSTSNASYESTAAQASEPTPKTSVQPTNTGLRPKRSASQPSDSAPSIMPSKPLENSGPISLRWIPRSAARAGATKPIDCASKPSMKTIAPHITATIIWKRPSGRSSIKRPTSSAVDDDCIERLTPRSPKARGDLHSFRSPR